MSIPTLVINNVEVPLIAMESYTQTYEFIGGFSLRRKLNGAGQHQENWKKLKTTISASGVIPPGFEGLAIDTAYAVACGTALEVTSTSNVITMPTANYRTGGIYTPVGRAWVPGNLGTRRKPLVSTPVSIVNGVATLNLVTGASGYRVLYYPTLTGFIERRVSINERSSEYSWELSIEEA